MPKTSNTHQLRRVSDNKLYPLSGNMTVGRRETCDLLLDDETGVSRQHATIAIKEGNVFVTDLGSTNGTMVNGQIIKDETQLNPSDKLVFDVQEYLFEIPEPEVDDDKTTFTNRAVEQPTTFRPPVDVAASAVAEAKPEPVAEAKPEPVAEAKPEPAAEAKPEPAAEAKPEPAAEAKPEPVAEAKPEPVAEAKPEPVAEAKPEPAAEAKPEPAPAAKPEPAAAEADAEGWDPFSKQTGGKTTFVPRVELDQMTTTDVDYNGSIPALVVIGGSLQGTIIPLEDNKENWNIGSSSSQDIVLNDAGVSGTHAVIDRDGKKWKLTDSLSQNQTFVNDKTAAFSYLSDGDIIDFGPIKCKFVIPQSYSPPAKSKAKPASASKAASTGEGIPWKIIIPVMLVAVLIVAAVGIFLFTDLASGLTG